jgi:hypothetical protein
MKVIDPGHKFLLQSYDGGEPQALVFMKREGPAYPFNLGHHSGTNCQEVIRALIERVKYLQHQVACDENETIIQLLRQSLRLFEYRAAQRRGQTVPQIAREELELLPTCPTCGHIECPGTHCAEDASRTVSSNENHELVES